MPGVLDTFRAFRRRLAAPRLLSPVLPARHPRRCRKCGGLLIPDRSRRYSFARPELVDAMGFQTKPGVGVSIKAGAGVIVADSSKPCCCGGVCCDNRTIRVSFSSVSLPNVQCCNRFEGGGFISYVFKITGTLGTYDCTFISISGGQCLWQATSTIAQQDARNNGIDNCTPAGSSTNSTIVVSVTFIGTNWTVGISMDASYGLFSGTGTGTCDSLPTISNTNSGTCSDATTPGVTKLGSGGSATLTLL